MNIFNFFKNSQSNHVPANTNAAKQDDNQKLDINQFINAQIFPTLVINHLDVIMLYNQPMTELFTTIATTPKTQYLNQDISTLIRIPQVFTLLDQVKQSSSAAQIEFELQSNGTRYFWLNISPIINADGKNHFNFTFRDLTQDIKAQRMRTDFIANASHELRTPLASISGFIETLQGPAKDDAKNQQKFLTIMHEQTGRMTRLIDDLLSLSKIELNQHIRPRNKTNLSEIANHCINTLTPIAAAAHIELQLDNELDEAFVIGDRDQLIQLFSNLINNAIKYGTKPDQENKIIFKIQKAQNNKHYTASIIDFGQGISADDLPRLTERFYRINQSQKQQGTGLGLAIVKHIAQRHGATLQFKSQLEQGTQANVTFKALPL